MIIPEIYRRVRDGDISVRESYYCRRGEYTACAREPLECLSPEAVERLLGAAVEEREAGLVRLYYRSLITDPDCLMRAFERTYTRIHEHIGGYAGMAGGGILSPYGESYLRVSLFRHDEVPPERLMRRAAWEKILHEAGCSRIDK